MDEMKRLYIEPTSDCNLACEMCFRHTWFDEEPGDMGRDVFEKVLATMPDSVESVFLGGMGEPLYHQDIIQMVVKVKETGVRVEMLTNGNLLDETMMHALMDAGLDRLWISLDEIEPSAMDGVGHPHYDEMIHKIKQINRLKLVNKSEMELGINFVVTKKNVEQLASLSMFVHKYRIAEVNISHMQPASKEAAKDILYERTLNMSIGSDVFGATKSVVNMPYMDFNLQEVKRGVGGFMGKMNLDLRISGNPVPRRSRTCRFVEDGITFVRSDGQVSPCMALLHNGRTIIDDTERKIYHHSFGDAGKDGVGKVWNSEEYVAFREKVKAFSFSPCVDCGHCEFAEENVEDCFGNEKPVCGACLWAEGLLTCP